ncbi:type II secretion system protein [Sulfurimonas sp.]|uniref:type II secretion system protein n=1 Tax=Sulfurimonas sp. TaxID=2022749 RepID=UPI0035690638
MVSKKNRIGRFAFTMIELIFAIVIIAISVLSLPMITQVTAKGVESNIVQEAIFAASAELMGAASGYWDSNSMQDYNLSHMSRVIDVDGDCDNNTTSSRYRLRAGHIEQPLHRRCVISNAGTVNNASDSTFVNLNNAVGSHAIFLLPNPEATGYKNDYSSSVSITQAGDIKYITINVTDSDGDLITVLKMQSANIGEIDYFKRGF